MTRKIEIVSVGNELLIGKTVNTNAQWLAKRVTSLGLSVERTTVIGDDVGQIAQALRETVTRSPLFILTTGGLGPTFDDKTLEGVARAFDFELEVNEKALEMIEEKYARYAKDLGRPKLELTPARVKMARLPIGAKPLPNPVGTAPAVTLQQDNVTVVALPGVPEEMKAIFDDSLLPLLKAAAGNTTFFETSLHVRGVMESAIAPLIDQVMHENPYIYIKSHPMGAEKKPRIELHLSTTAEKAATARQRVGRALVQISELIKARGGKTRTVKLKKP